MPLLVFNLWNDLIKEYSRCDLTKPSDRMFAMAGIAKLFRHVTGDEYVAGWWKSHLLESLDWRIFELRSRQAVDYRAPSWSWASVDNPIQMAGVSPSMKLLVELVDVQVTAREPDAMANILDATLTLKCSNFTVVCHYLDNGNHVLRIDRGDLATYFYPDSLDTEFPEGKRIVCIPYKKTYYLSGSDEKEAPQLVCFMAEEMNMCGSNVRHRRLGFFFLDGTQIEKFGTGWEYTEIILV